MQRVMMSLALTATFFLTGSVALAQNPNQFNPSPQAGLANTLVLVVTPENPRPNSQVTIEVKTTFFDLTRATIGWLENGKLSESGLGKTKHSIMTGVPGSSVVVTAVVSTEEGLVYQKDIILRPETVDLIWESPSTVSPFYKGKALYPMLGKIVVVAMPDILDANGERVGAKSLYYTWKKDNQVLGDASGYGRDTLTITDPIYRVPFTVSVEVMSNDELYTADGSVSINNSPQTILVYENNPLYGILFNRAIGNTFALSDKEGTVEAFPYFFNAKSRSDLSYHWTVNGQDAQGFQGPYLTVRNVNNESGTASVYLEVTRENSFNDGATAGFNVLFGTAANNQ